MSNNDQLSMCPWMIQTACEYVRAARLLWNNDLGTPSMTSVAIGFEILFKSFNSIPHGPSGLGEQYCSIERTHNLLQLFDAIPEAIRERLNIQSQRGYFEGKGAKLFLGARYPYEPGAIAGGTDAIIDVAERMIHDTIVMYQQMGCDDPWITSCSVSFGPACTLDGSNFWNTEPAV